jgi:amidase
MTRSVEDAARLLCVMAGFDAQDPNSLNAPVPNYLQSLCVREDGGKPLAGKRIGIDWSYVSDGVQASVVDVTRHALDTLAELGCEIVEIDVPQGARVLAEVWGLTCGVECAGAHTEHFPARQDEYGPVLRGLIELGLRTSEQDYQALQQLRARFSEQLDQVLAGVDAIISPCMPLATPSVQLMDNGAPAGDLPGSFQLIGSKLDEETLIRLGSAFEQAAETIRYPELQG